MAKEMASRMDEKLLSANKKLWPLCSGMTGGTPRCKACCAV